MSERQEIEDTASSSSPESRPGVLRRLRGALIISVVLLLVIWVGFTVLPEDTGVSLGLFYQVFFTVVVLLGAAFFWMIDLDDLPHPGSALKVWGSVLAVYLATVGFMVAVGFVLPQFEGGLVEAVEPQDAFGRGQALFFDPAAGCFLCHAIDGVGAFRGPNLTELASRAGDRVAGLSAEEYVGAKILGGMNYEFTVPEYAPIMPPFEHQLDAEQVDDLVAFLLGPR